MAVVLTILKILGIILLCIIGLLLLLLILVLVVPIRYRVEGAFTEEQKFAKGKVRWMFFRVLGHFDKDEGLLGEVKVAWFTVKRFERKFGKDEEVQVIEEAGGQTLEEAIQELEEKEAAEEQKKAEEAKAADAKKAEVTKPAEAGKAEEAKTAEAKKAEEAKTADAKKTETASEAGKKADTGGVPPDQPKAPEIDMTVGKDAPEEKKAPGEEVIDKIEDNWDKMNRKMSHLQQFWERPATQRTWERLKKILGKWLKHLKPTKAKVDMHFGFTSPATTGSMLGYMARFYPLYGNWLTIYPDFYYKVFEAEGFVKGRIRIGTFAIPALFLYLRKDTRRTIKLAKKI